MGDMADFVNSSFPDTYWEEDTDGYYNDYPPAYARPKKQLNCKVCGAVHVYWSQYPSGKWFIFDMGSRQPHKCKED